MFNSTIPGHSGPIKVLESEYASLDALKAKLEAMRPLTPGEVKTLRDDMVLRYTYHSNAIEGNTLTLMETKVVLEDGLTVGGKSMREHLEAINHREAIGFLEAVSREHAPLSERLIKDLHQLVLKGIDNDNAGKYRQQNVLISGAGFQPPNFLHVQEHMEAFIQWHTNESPKLHPVERAARVHADFVNIHPFIDGNGRTARLLMNLALLQAGFPIAIVPVEERSNYYANLDMAAVRGNYLPFTRQLCELVKNGFEPYWFVGEELNEK